MDPRTNCETQGEQEARGRLDRVSGVAPSSFPPHLAGSTMLACWTRTGTKGRSRSILKEPRRARIHGQAGRLPCMKRRPKRVVGKKLKQSYRFAVNKSEDGSETHWLVVYEYRRQAETEEVRAVSPREQTLAAHQRAVVEKLKQSAQAVGLPDDYAALAIAARLHDEGKALWRWQRAFNAPRGSRASHKTLGPLNIKLLDGYRHEFGSCGRCVTIRHSPSLIRICRTLSCISSPRITATDGR